jgi:putative Mn2+ efflux pump MntP
MFASFVQEKTGWWIAGFMMFLLGLYMFYYNYKSLRNYFGQRRGKTILKFSILVLLTFILFGLLSTAFVINSLLAA